MLVVDASLAFKWVVPEPNSDCARQFFAEHLDDMHAPDLLLVEVAGSLVRRTNEGKLRVQSAVGIIAAFEAHVGMAVRLHRVTPELTTTAADLAMSFGHPLKDCIYLALADQLGCPLVTCDAKFRERVGDNGRVRLLADMS